MVPFAAFGVGLSLVDPTGHEMRRQRIMLPPHFSSMTAFNSCQNYDKYGSLKEFQSGRRGKRIMKTNTKTWIIAVAGAISFASLGFKANATLIDLGERDLASRLNGVQEAQAFIESDQGLAPGTLMFLSAFDAD